jgi:hypothetical protein
VIRGADKNQRRNAEGRIHDQRREETVAGDEADGLREIVQEIADGPEKQENGDVQEHVNSVHEPPHLGLVKALK